MSALLLPNQAPSPLNSKGLRIQGLFSTILVSVASSSLAIAFLKSSLLRVSLAPIALVFVWPPVFAFQPTLVCTFIGGHLSILHQGRS